MTDYKATSVQWADAEYYGNHSRLPRPLSEYACILELRARIEALEAVRPKPPSLKEQALAALDDAIMRGDCITISDALPTIRLALEALPND